MSSTPSNNMNLSPPLSLSHLLLQLLTECSDDELLQNAMYIISLINSSGAFDAHNHISDDTLKTIAQACFSQEYSIGQTTSTLSNALNQSNEILSKIFKRFSQFFLTPASNSSNVHKISIGLNLLQLFISQCDFPLLQASILYLHQSLLKFIKLQQSISTQHTLPTSFFLKGLNLLIILYLQSSTPGWTSLLQSLPPLRTILDLLFSTAFKTLQLPSFDLNNDDQQYPEIHTLVSKPISTLSPGSFATIEYLLQLLFKLLSNNATRPLCKTHIPHIHSFILLLIDLDIHSTTHLSLQTNPTTSSCQLNNSNYRILTLMSQIFALSCYCGKYTDIKQALSLKSNTTTNSNLTSTLLLAFPAGIVLHGLTQNTIQSSIKSSDANPTGEAKQAKNTFQLDQYLTTAKVDEDGNGIIVDTTKTASTAVSGGQGDLSLVGGVITKDVHARDYQGNKHLLALRVAEDDKIASEYLTDEFLTTQQSIYNKQQQILQHDLKRFIATMLLTTIVAHLIHILPPTFTSHNSLLQLQQSLYQSQLTAGFSSHYPLSFQLPIIPTIHLESFRYQQTIISRTLSLLTLFQSLFSISPTSLQQSSQISSTLLNTSWLGFGGSGATFMQGSYRDLFHSSHNNSQHNHNAKSQNILMNDKSNTNKGNDIDQLLITTSPTLPTSLSMTYNTQNEQWHTQQMNQQQFQFESPLYRILQLLHIIFELELNTANPTKEVALLQQLLPPIQSTALNLFKTVIISTNKQCMPYINSFIPTMLTLFQSTTQTNRLTYLLANQNILILQQQLLSTFNLLLQQFSNSIFTSNILSQFMPLVLFDFMSFFHDLIRIQHCFKLISSTQRQNLKAAKDATKNNNQPHQDQHFNGKTAIPLTRVIGEMSNAKSFSFVSPSQDKLLKLGSISTTNQTNSQIPSQQALLTTPSSHQITPHSFQFQTLSQQQLHESYINTICDLLIHFFSTTTSSLLIPNDVFVSISRTLLTTLHTILTPNGTLLLPISYPTLQQLLSLLHTLAIYQPSIGSFSPVLGEAMTYFAWVLHIPHFALVQYAKQCLTYYSMLLSPAMQPPSLPAETITILNQLRDRAIASLHGNDDANSFSSTKNSNNRIENQFSFTNSTTPSSTTTTSSTTLSMFDPNSSFPLLLFPFQQFNNVQYDIDNDNEDNDTSEINLSYNLTSLMTSMYHQQVRTVNIVQSTDQSSTHFNHSQNTMNSTHNHNHHQDHIETGHETTTTTLFTSTHLPMHESDQQNVEEEEDEDGQDNVISNTSIFHQQKPTQSVSQSLSQNITLSSNGFEEDFDDDFDNIDFVGQ